MTEEAGKKTFAEIVRDALTSVKADGSPAFTREEIEDYIVFCVFGYGITPTTKMQAAVARFLTKLRLPANASAQVVADAVIRYFDENPLNPELLARIEHQTVANFARLVAGFAREHIHALRLIGKEAPLELEESRAERKPRLARGLSGTPA